MAVFTHGVSSFHASHKVFPNFTFQMTSIFKIIIRNFVSSSRHLENAIKTSEMTSFRRFVVSGTRRSHAHIGPMFGSQMNHHSGCSATQSSNNCRAVITSSVSFCLWPIKVSPNRTFHFVTNIFKLVNKPTQRINEYLQWANFATLEFYGKSFVDILANLTHINLTSFFSRYFFLIFIGIISFNDPINLTILFSKSIYSWIILASF